MLKNRCIICNIEARELELNKIPMYKCPSCNLIWQKTSHISDNYYIEKESDTSSEKINSRIQNCYDRIKTFRKYIDLNDLLDIGAGDGTFVKLLLEHGFRNIIGVEPNIALVNFAKQNCIPVYRGEIFHLPEEILRRKYTNVSLLHVLEHLPNPLEALIFIRDKLLKEGGFVIIEAPNTKGWSFSKRNYQWKLINREHLYYFNEFNIKKLLEKAGFRVIKIGKRDFNPQFLGVRECLFRLGLIRKNPEINFDDNFGDKGLRSESKIKVYQNKFIKIIKKILNYTLSKVVKILGRLDYFYVIAQKV